MSTAAVRTAVTERGTNANVTNASSLVPGKSCVSVFGLAVSGIRFMPATYAKLMLGQEFVTFPLAKMASL